MRYKAKPTITQLRRELVADSIERARTMEKLLKLVREDERQTDRDLRLDKMGGERGLSPPPQRKVRHD